MRAANLEEAVAMGWSISTGVDGRDIGYGVVAFCDHPGCGTEIDRGLGYACGGQHGETEISCGLYFCGKHGGGMQCERCSDFQFDMEEWKENGDVYKLCPRFKSFAPTFDHPLWIKHKLLDKSWKKWRDENPEKVREMTEKIPSTLLLRGRLH